MFCSRLKISCLLLLSCAVTLTSCGGGRAPAVMPIEVKDGDLIFRCGRSPESHAVRVRDRQSGYSHVGVALWVGDSLMVIHSVPDEEDHHPADTIKCEPWSDFWQRKRAKTGAIFRLPITDEQRQVVRGYLLEKWAAQTPFDHNYLLSDTTEIYCTELVWRAYERAGVDLSEGRRSSVGLFGFTELILLPSDLEQHADLSCLYFFE